MTTTWCEVKRVIKPYLVEVLGLGGVTQNRLISPKGLYSSPEEETGLKIPLSGGTNQDIIMPIQKEIELEKNDIIVTDDKSGIHFKNEDEKIEIKTKELLIEIKEKGVMTAKGITLDGEEVIIEADNVKIEAKNGLIIEGDVIIKGKLTVEKDTEVKGTLKNKNINMTSHKHTQTNAPANGNMGAPIIYTPPPSDTSSPK